MESRRREKIITIENQEQSASTLPSAADALRDICVTEADAATASGSWERSAVEIAWRGRRLLILATCVGLLLGLMHFFLAPRVYESSAVVYIDRPSTTNDPGRLKNDGVAAANPVTQASVLKSTAVLTRALAEPALASAVTFADVDDRLTFLREGLDIRGDDEDETVILSFKAPDPDEAALILNAVLRAYFANYNDRLARFDQPNETTAGQAFTSLIEAAPGVDAATPSAPSALPSFGQSGSQRMTDMLVQNRLAELTTRFTAAEARERQAREAVASAEAAGDDLDQLIRIAESIGIGGETAAGVMGPVRSARLTLAFAQREREAFPSQWGSEHPAAKQYADTMDQSITRLALTESLAAQTLRRMVDDAQKTITRERERLAAQLDREQQRARALTRLPLEVVDEAHPQREAISPKGALSLMIGTLAGFLLGMGGLVSTELIRHARSREELDPDTDVNAETGLTLYRPNGAQLPARSPGRARHAITPAAIQSGGEGAPMVLGVVPRIAATHRLMAPDYDKAGTSVHHIRAILEALARRQGIRSLGLVSAQRGSGKTSLAMGVASSLALSGTRVLVADCDIAGRLERGQARNRSADDDRPDLDPTRTTPLPGDRNRTIDGIAIATGHLQDTEPGSTHRGTTNGHGPDAGAHTASGLEGPVGIAGVIEGRAVADCIIPSATPGLAFLPANSAKPGHIGRLSDPVVGRLIDEAIEDYDIVLVDTGPVPGSVEAMLVAGRVDAIVLILDDRTSMAEYKRTLSYLKVAGATVAGVVFNKAVDPEDPFSQAFDPDQGGRLSDNPSLDGSGILAASVLTDAESGFSEMDWERIDPEDLIDGVATPRPEQQDAEPATVSQA